jgi:hypothetical protein
MISKFESIYSASNNILEKSLVIFVSTRDDFQSIKDNGGLDVIKDWRGYEMIAIENQYRQNKLSFFHAEVDTKYENKSIKPATINNLKKDLINECGETWANNRSGDVYTSTSDFSTCEISRGRNGTYHVVVSAKYSALK